MRFQTTPFAIAALLACPAFGQPAPGQDVDRVFHFTNSPLPQSRQEICNMVRAIAAIQKASVNDGAGVLAVSGTAAQVAMAEWLFYDMDRPANAPLPGKASLEYNLQGSANDVVRIFYLANSPGPQSSQEIINAIRSLGDIQRVMIYNASRALAMRGTVEQIALAEWMINLLDVPAGGLGQDSGRHEFVMAGLPPMAGTTSSVARAFYPKYADTAQGLRETVNLVRTITEIPRAVGVTVPRALAMRGTAEQAALADWLIQQLDQPAGAPNQNPAALEYRMAGSANPVVRVFYPAHADTPQALQGVVGLVRSTTSIYRAVAYNATKALALRGTGDEMARAEQLLRERDKP